ncbi:hypothetical protein HanPSC8_Chr02g0080791 [Helianthus annuus]|nr:hypothetical protein HanPSC8_Chr02g0080791 [Helianthus annuus]
MLTLSLGLSTNGPGWATGASAGDADGLTGPVFSNGPGRATGPSAIDANGLTSPVFSNGPGWARGADFSTNGPGWATGPSNADGLTVSGSRTGPGRATGGFSGAATGLTGSIPTSSPVLTTELSIWNVAFETSVKTFVRALEDSHGSGGWYVMASIVNMSTENTKTEKPTLLIIFIAFGPIRSGEELLSFIFQTWILNLWNICLKL